MRPDRSNFVMAIELPYFKFIVTEWLTGEIVFEDLVTQGLFINICSWYWHKSCRLSMEEIAKRYPNETERLAKLTDRFFSVNLGLINIAFLDEQFDRERYKIEVNRINGGKGGRPKTKGIKPNANRTLTQTKANANPNITENYIVRAQNDYTYIKVLELFNIKLNNNIKYNQDQIEKEAEKFFNFYESKGWMVGKNKMKSVAGAIGGWVARNEEIKEKTEPVSRIQKILNNHASNR